MVRVSISSYVRTCAVSVKHLDQEVGVCLCELQLPLNHPPLVFLIPSLGLLRYQWISVLSLVVVNLRHQTVAIRPVTVWSSFLFDSWDTDDLIGMCCIEVHSEIHL